MRSRTFSETKGHYVGMAVQNKSLQENVSSEMKLIMTLAVVVIFLIPTVTTNSWFEPVLYPDGHGRGDRPEQRNKPVYRADILLTNSVSAVLQLACSMDYSIFLSHAFAREKAKDWIR